MQLVASVTALALLLPPGVLGRLGEGRKDARRMDGRVIVKRKTTQKLAEEGRSEAEIAAVRDQGKIAIAKHKHTVVMDLEGSGLDIQVVDVGRGNEKSFIDALRSEEKSFVASLHSESLAAADGGIYEILEPDWIESPTVVPDDTFVSLAWQHTALQSHQAWELAGTGPGGKVVAICDSGLWPNHPDLEANRVEGYNAVTKLTEAQGGDVSPVNGNDHGTMAAGAAAAIGNNGEGLSGVGWRLQHRPIQVSTPELNGNAYSSTLALCAQWACDRGDIASISFSGAEGQLRRQAATYCKSKGSLLFNAAGNDNRDIVGWDSDADDLIVVGATDANDARSTFSAYGSYVDVMAPGTNIMTTSIDNYSYASGTSFACPIAAGLAAVIWTANPSLSPDQVERILKESATDLGAAGYDNEFSHGRISSYEALRHPLVGLVPTQSPTASPMTSTPTPKPLLSTTASNSTRFLAPASNSTRFLAPASNSTRFLAPACTEEASASGLEHATIAATCSLPISVRSNQV